ncbi:hypothetical protein EW026_g7067 [Hermanssonia centrifuga]|uniref:Uncharacterized protein n=1 Tax=Hermanssonia centrifuga TaxID=98765 RepID=A0A4S4KDE7_9APHY|nr:hypothetical protein EW026_g7067 [Hermanssonia centrifuga]
MVDSSATFDTTQTATEVHVDVVAQVSGFIPSDITGIPPSETQIEIVANSPHMEQTRELATTSILTDNVNMSLPPADISHVEPSTETPGTPTVITHVEIVNEAPHVEESSPGNSSTVLAPTEHVTQIILATPTIDDADIVAHVPSPSVPPVLEHELAGDGLLVVLSPSVQPAEYITDGSTPAMTFDAAEHLQYIMETTKAMVQEAVAASKEVHELLAEVRLEKSHAQTEREAAAAEKERMLEAAAQERQIGIAELNAKILEFSENLVAVQAEKDKLAVESEEGVSQMKALEEKVDHLQRQLESAEVHRVEMHVEHGRVLEELSAEKEIYVAKEKDLEAQLLAEKEVYDGSKKELEDKLAAIVAQQEEDKQLRDSESSERALVHEQREQEHTAIGHDLRAKIQALEDDLAAAVAKQEQDEQLRISEDAERSAAQDEHERIVTEVLLQKEESLATSEARIAALEETLAASVDRERILEETIAEQGERIRTMEEALAATRTQLEELEQNRVAEFEQRDAAMADAEAKHNADIASVQAQLEELEQRRVNEIAERDAALSEADEKHVASIADVDAKHSEALSEAEAKHTADIQAIQAQLEVSVAQREQEKEQQSAENAEREAAHAERERALLEDLERERANFEQHNALLKECNERISALGTDLQQERQQRVAETTEQREADKQESRERAEAQDLQVSEIKDKLAQMGEHSDELLSQQQTRISDICSQLDKIEEAATEERRLVAEERTQREEERAEAATKPSIESIVEGQMREISAHMQMQLESLENDLRTDGTRQHDETLEAVRITIQDQAPQIISHCLDELSNMLNNLSARQQTEVLNSVRTTIQDQITLHISFYLEELGKLIDANNTQQLVDILDTMRATAHEQVEFNVEIYLDDFCKKLSPEMTKFLREVKEQADEKRSLQRQIDTLKGHKFDMEQDPGLYGGGYYARNGASNFKESVEREDKEYP